MMIATRVMNLLSGVLILASGVYIQLRFVEVLSEAARLIVGVAALAYFGLQVYRFLAVEGTKWRGSSSADDPQNFGLDIVRR